jgi:hypothetical protein
VSILNKNRNSSNTSGIATVSYDGTAATGGTLLLQEYLSDQRQSGGENRGQDEWILKQNTTYAVSLFGTANSPATLELHWYEHTNKN